MEVFRGEQGYERSKEGHLRLACQKYMIRPRMTTAKAGKYNQKGE
jgi:hypothetical protein